MTRSDHASPLTGGKGHVQIAQNWRTVPSPRSSPTASLERAPRQGVGCATRGHNYRNLGEQDAPSKHG
eukprot:3089187-Prymnesium_polylepis.1